MSSYSAQKRFAEDNAPAFGRTKRMNCPFCGGPKTLTISNTLDGLVWNCYRASCSAKGGSGKERTVSEIRARLLPQESGTTQKFVLPDWLVSVGQRYEVVEYLTRNNCLPAVKSGLIEVRYDPKDHRCVFLIRQDGELVDAAGRALTRGAKPKWKRYGNSGEPLVVGTHSVAALVEDAASACAVSQEVTGVAALGTSLTPECISRLTKFSKVLIALDPDATTKAVAIHRKMSYYTQCTVLQIPDDLKYFGPARIRELLSPYTSNPRIGENPHEAAGDDLRGP